MGLPGLVMIALSVAILACSSPESSHESTMEPATGASEERAALESLGYLATAEQTPHGAQLGVLLHDRERTARFFRQLLASVRRNRPPQRELHHDRR